MRKKLFSLFGVFCTLIFCGVGCVQPTASTANTKQLTQAPVKPAETTKPVTQAEAETPKTATEAAKPAAQPEAAKTAKPTSAYKPPTLSSPDSWSMVVVPDVQAYTERPRNHGIVDIMNTWIVDNLDTLRIQQVLFTGDLVYRNDQRLLTPDRYSLLSREQWKAFSRLMERLDGKVPYILCTGNHDYGHNSAENRNTFFNDYFPTDRNPMTRKHLVSCAYNSFDMTSLENSAYEFTAPHPDNRQFLFITLEFAPTDATLEWAKKLVDEPRFENHICVILTHSYLSHKGTRLSEEKYALSKQGGNAGEAIFQKLVYPSKNIRLVICGHIAAPDKWERGIVFSTDTNSAGKTVAQMAFNTQAITGWHGNGGDGWLRLLEFMPDKKTVKATTFSPFFAISPSTQRLAWRHEPLNEFTFTIE